MTSNIVYSREKLIITALKNAEYNYLTRTELQKITGIPERTLRRLIIKLENFKIIHSFRSIIKVIELG